MAKRITLTVNDQQLSDWLGTIVGLARMVGIDVSVEEAQQIIDVPHKEVGNGKKSS